jgi:hypothetical protein
MPFTPAEFMALLASYNEAVWPLQLVLLVFCLFLAVTALRGHRRGVGYVYLGLALLWAWMGIVFHGRFFRVINSSAIIWAVLFTVQAFLFLLAASRPRVAVKPSRGGTWLGLSAVFYAVFLYPVIGEIGGHHFPAAPTFGLPCPTTIATFGLLALLPVREPRWLPVIPTVWAAVGSWAITIGLYEDLGLPIFALAYWILQWHERGSPSAQYFQPGPVPLPQRKIVSRSFRG